MNTTSVIIFVVLFIALDVLFFALIARRMNKPSISAAFARTRGFSMIPDNEAPSVGLRLRGALRIPRGDMFNIVRLPHEGGEGYLFTTLPERRSRYPRTPENRRQFIAVLMKTPFESALFIHPPVRPPFAGFKQRRLFRIFKAGAFLSVGADLLLSETARWWRIRVEPRGGVPEALLVTSVIDILMRAPRARGLSLLVEPGGFVIYINPLLGREEDVGRFYDFTVKLAGALSMEGRK